MTDWSQFTPVEVLPPDENWPRHDKPKPKPKREINAPLQGVRSALQGLTFGFSDEIGAAIAALPASIVTGNSYRDVYNDMHSELSKDRDQYSQDHPYAALAAELGGALLSGGAAAGRLATTKAAQALPAVPRTMAIGGIEGAVYGAGKSDDGVIAPALKDGAIGAFAAPIVDKGIDVAKNLAAPVMDRITGSFSTPDAEARDQLSRHLAREGQRVDDIEVPPGYEDITTLADTTQTGRGLLEGLANDAEVPGVRNIVNDTLGKRNKAQLARVQSKMDSLLGQGRVKEAVQTLKQERAMKAEPLYFEATKQPLKMTDYMKVVLDEKRGVPEVKAAFKEAARRSQTKRATGEQVSHIAIFDEAKRVLDDKISVLYRNGRSNLARDLRIVKNKLLAEVDEQIPVYKQARDVYAGDSALIDAAEKGKKILQTDADELEAITETMSKSEKELFSLGAKKAIRDKLMMGREGTNNVKKIMSEMNLERLSHAFPSETAFKNFKKDIEFEASIFETERVLHNSMTAFRQSVQNSLDNGGLTNEIGHDTAGIIANTIKRIVNRKMPDEVKERLAKLVLTPLKDLSDKDLKKMDKTISKMINPKQSGLFHEALNALRQPVLLTPVLSEEVQ